MVNIDEMIKEKAKEEKEDNKRAIRACNVKDISYKLPKPIIRRVRSGFLWWNIQDEYICPQCQEKLTHYKYSGYGDYTLGYFVSSCGYEYAWLED